MFRSVNLKYFSGNNKDIFTDIFFNNKWGNKYSFSGNGSSLEETKTILEELPHIIKKYKIRSILDIPCGDFHWMKELDFNDLEYIGADIVTELIERNIAKHNIKNVNFQNLDLLKDPLPKSDLIFCRDCLVHLSFNDIFKALTNIKKTNAKFLITTNFVQRISNEDIKTGSWRTINLRKDPFNFPKPNLSISENCSEGSNAYNDKELSLWEVKNIPDYN